MSSNREFRASYRVLSELADKYGYDFKRVTRKGHYQWIRRSDGLLVLTPSKIHGSWHSIKNAERNFKTGMLSTDKDKHSNAHSDR